MNPFKEEIGEKNGRFYTINQVKVRRDLEKVGGLDFLDDAPLGPVGSVWEAAVERREQRVAAAADHAVARQRQLTRPVRGIRPSARRRQRQRAQMAHQ